MSGLGSGKHDNNYFSKIESHEDNRMIHRYFKDGQKIDVAGLNQITVLLDRSESELTEIGLNEWNPKLDSPPHKHTDKDQVFYIVSGEGIVKLGDEQHAVKPGYLVYVPAGLVHQSVTIGDEPLCYVLYNVFNDSAKEGHATFAEHIEKVKMIRKQQAETGNAEVDDSGTVGKIRTPKVIADVYSGKELYLKSYKSIFHLTRTQTNRFEFTTVHWEAGKKGNLPADGRTEHAFFVLKGEGLITMGDETEKLKAGDLVYVPRDIPYTVQSLEADLIYLSISSMVSEL
jgi:mannose-6-phosphate isomerase-like protein (cupin superfamily)